MSEAKVWLLINLLSIGTAVEWFGDQRGGPPDGAQPFYDLTYDDELCQNSELKSHAVSDYIYFGRMLSAFLTDSSASCIRECYYNQKCQSVNYYRPMTYQEQGFCELLAETQWDNPNWMKAYKNAVYYEQIRCETQKEKDQKKNALGAPSRPKQSATPLLLRRLFSKLSDFVKRTHRQRMT